MPLIMDGVLPPSFWEAKKNSHAARTSRSFGKRTEFITLALVNNMPDPALEDTELQFFQLLEVASGDIPVYAKLYSLPGVPRGARGEEHLRKYYSSTTDLWDSEVDGVIVTGTEPHHSDLRREPYWESMTAVFDWAEHNTVSTILSCLAAHASVLHSDSIPRRPLSDKQCGVFECDKVSDHAITRLIPDSICNPHSRWNEIREKDLLASGYIVLTKSVNGGVDSFLKKKGNSLFVHFQGHPEYAARTLLKEYRRDIKRFLRGERETYPTMPHGYFNQGAIDLLSAFRELSLNAPREELLSAFPEEAVGDSLEKPWDGSAILMYRSWLQYVSSRAWLHPASHLAENSRPTAYEKEATV